MVTQVTPSSIGSIASNAQTLSEVGRPKLRPLTSPIATPDSANVDPRMAFAAVQDALTQARNALDVALAAGKTALAELARGGEDPSALSRYAQLISEADGPAGGLLSGAVLSVRAGADGATVDIEGVDARTALADGDLNGGVQRLSEALTRFAALADKLSAHTQFVDAAKEVGASTDMNADEARLAALAASQSLRSSGASIATAGPLALLALFRA